MQTTAASNPEGEFAQAFADAAGTDTTDPSELRELVPEENVPGLFDQLLSETQRAEQFVYVEDGNYEALRVQTAIDASFTASEVASELREIATATEDETSGELGITATGMQVVSDETQDALLSTVIQGLALTTVSVFVFLAGAYRLTGNPASLGIVTLLPVVFSVTWILGTMWLIGIPFNSLTGTITSLTVGLGIAYSIHISSRYELELRRQGDVWDAMETTVTGTGGALLGSAATTVGGFGTLAFAIFPVLQQFGIITGLTIIYAFLASVFVLPSLLVLWTRYLGPSAYFPPHDAETEDADQEPTAADGGRDV
jgi:Predicted exporters of the RND superfamily